MFLFYRRKSGVKKVVQRAQKHYFQTDFQLKVNQLQAFSSSNT